MVAIITGDIINSTEDESVQWLELLKQVLNRYGKSPETWEIFRGDSFQVEVEPKNALLTAFHIKMCIKQAENRDVRMGIGIGEASHKSPRISESNGPAYIRSGLAFEELKKQTLAIKTDSGEIDEAINLMVQLALLIADNWTSSVATVLYTAVENPEMSQKELAKILKKSQSSVSEAMSRGGYHEVMKLNQYFVKRIPEL